jgi:homoserine acetyltransferase
MLKRLKKWLRSFTISPLDSPVVMFPVDTFQEDRSLADVGDRVSKIFDAQQEVMNMRAMKAHDPSCEDSFTCTKEVCWIWEPDKVVSPEYKIIAPKKDLLMLITESESAKKTIRNSRKKVNTKVITISKKGK